MLPTYDKFFPYVLESLKDGNPKKLKDIRKEIAQIMNLTEEQTTALLPSKTQSIFDNRTNWAAYYLKRAGILTTPQRGVYILSQEGIKYIEKNGYSILKTDLEKYDSFKEFIKPKDSVETINKENTGQEELTPEDKITDAINTLNQQLADELIEEIMSMSPIFFERLVLDLLYQMGYGGKRDNSIIHTSFSQDDGIDGLIKEDELGLDYIYIQAKRWSNVVGQPEIQKFSGALSGFAARKGVFITTSKFSSKAIDYAKTHPYSTMVLIDGKKLADLMITYGVGLSVEYEYRIQKIDSDYFNEDRF